MAYHAHGEYRLWCDEKTLYAELSGMWNEETALEFDRDFRALATHFTGPWGHLVYLNDWELCTPEMFEVIESLVTWCIQNGLTRAANVYEPSGIKEAIVNKMVVQSEGKFKRAVFDNPRDAANWLTQEGFPSTTRGRL